jgi:hypothetical protein
MTKRGLAMVTVLGALVSLSGSASHGSKKEEAISDNGLVTSESFKRNYFFYREIGGQTSVKGEKKVRKWWCVFLCKRRVSRKVDRIEIRNVYFSEVAPGTFESLEREHVCSNAASCRERQSAFGFTLNLNFRPGGIDNLLPIHGVITRHRIVDGAQQPVIIFTSIGKHPGPVID